MLCAQSICPPPSLAQPVNHDVSCSLTISVLVAHVDVVVLEAGALLGILVPLDLCDQRRLARLFVA